MRRLLVVDHIVNAGGVERCLEETSRVLATRAASRGWEVTLLINRVNTARRPVRWAETLRATGLDVGYLFDSPAHRLTEGLREPHRLTLLPGSTWLIGSIRQLLCHSPSRQLRSLAGDVRACIEQVAASKHVDLAFFNFPFNLECPRLRCPIVILPHDLAHRQARFPPPDAANTERRLEGWFENAAGILVGSRTVQHEIRKHYPRFVEKSRVVRLGIPAPVEPIDETLVARISTHVPRPFLLSCGWLTAHKDQITLVEAVGRLKVRGISVRLVFTGPNTLGFGSGEGATDDYRGQLERRARELNLVAQRDVYGLGFVDAETLVALYRSATMLVVTSHYEAGSFPVREALQQACPVVCSRIPAMCEEMQELGDPVTFFTAGSVTELEDRILEVLSDEGAARRRAAAAVSRLGSVFSWDRLADDYFSFFEEILGDAARAPQRAGNG